MNCPCCNRSLQEEKNVKHAPEASDTLPPAKGGEDEEEEVDDFHSASSWEEEDYVLPPPPYSGESEEDGEEKEEEDGEKEEEDGEKEEEDKEKDEGEKTVNPPGVNTEGGALDDFVEQARGEAKLQLDAITPMLKEIDDILTGNSEALRERKDKAAADREAAKLERQAVLDAKKLKRQEKRDGLRAARLERRATLDAEKLKMQEERKGLQAGIATLQEITEKLDAAELRVNQLLGTPPIANEGTTQSVPSIPITSTAKKPEPPRPSLYELPTDLMKHIAAFIPPNDIANRMTVAQINTPSIKISQGEWVRMAAGGNMLGVNLTLMERLKKKSTDGHYTLFISGVQRADLLLTMGNAALSPKLFFWGPLGKFASEVVLIYDIRVAEAVLKHVMYDLNFQTPITSDDEVDVYANKDEVGIIQVDTKGDKFYFKAFKMRTRLHLKSLREMARSPEPEQVFAEWSKNIAEYAKMEQAGWQKREFTPKNVTRSEIGRLCACGAEFYNSVKVKFDEIKTLVTGFSTLANTGEGGKRQTLVLLDESVSLVKPVRRMFDHLEHYNATFFGLNNSPLAIFVLQAGGEMCAFIFYHPQDLISFVNSEIRRGTLRMIRTGDDFLKGSARVTIESLTKDVHWCFRNKHIGKHELRRFLADDYRRILNGRSPEQGDPELLTDAPSIPIPPTTGNLLRVIKGTLFERPADCLVSMSTTDHKSEIGLSRWFNIYGGQEYFEERERIFATRPFGISSIGTSFITTSGLIKPNCECKASFVINAVVPGYKKSADGENSNGSKKVLLAECRSLDDAFVVLDMEFPSVSNQARELAEAYDHVINTSCPLVHEMLDPRPDVLRVSSPFLSCGFGTEWEISARDVHFLSFLACVHALRSYKGKIEFTFCFYDRQRMGLITELTNHIPDELRVW